MQWAMIANFGLLAFRDPNGSRPLVIGRHDSEKGVEYVVASESVALDVLGYTLVRDVEPGEAIFIDMDGNFFSRQCAEKPELHPCIFEYVYLARPDSVIDGISVYQTRLHWAKAWERSTGSGVFDIDVVIQSGYQQPAPAVANALNLTYREGSLKTVYRPYFISWTSIA